MKTSLRAGNVLDSGFEILEVIDLAELNAPGIWARHVKSGAEVFHILNDDTENLFGFAFATAPEDSTGVAHILEHSSLCGSENYPLKDAFLVLAQGSLQTFLNAWTFPDKTVYPASSVNEQDYFNLMAVYGDAVFRPLLSEWTFMQEGHRLAFAGDKTGRAGGLSITGVVYNEMKGAYSSMDEYAGRWSLRAVLPDTPYAFDSGGDPEKIPDLTWEGLRDFHRRKYSPANCRIFLAGNIPTEKQFSFLNEKFLALLPPGKAAPSIPKAKPWAAPQNITIPCPAGAEQKSMVVLSWLCNTDAAGADFADPNETIALSALTEILLGHDGSPLTRLLIESGLGEDLAPVTGLEGEFREIIFTAGLRGVDRGGGNTLSGKIEKLILGELQRLASGGIPKEEITAALLAMEFSNREIRRSGGPYSLVWMRRSLRSWLHGGRPWDSLLFVPAFTELKRRLAADSRYFEKLIQKYLLDNPHRALVCLLPQEGFQEQKDAALAEQLAKKEAALSDAERRVIIEKAAALERVQSEGDSPDALAAIPHLSRKDLVPEIETVPREFHDARGIPALSHELFTNGISYGDFFIPLDILESADYPWLPLFSRAIVSLGLPNLDYGEVSSLLARTVGAFYAGLQSGSILHGSSAAAALPTGTLDLRGRDWLSFRLKALDEKIPESLDLILRIITEADFSDQKRIRDLVLEMKNDVDASLAPAGHSYAAGRSSCLFSRSRAVDELWSGVTQLEFVHRIAAMDTAEICRTLRGIRDTLIQHGGLLVNLTGNADAITAARKGIAEKFSALGAPRPRNSRIAEGAPFFAMVTNGTKPGANYKAEVLSSPTLQVGFAAMTLNGASLHTRRAGTEAVLAHWLSTGALWEDIRMKGGAYGAFAHPDGIEGTFTLSTYRDPSPLRSLEAFPAILAETPMPDEETLTKALIGTFSKETRPRTAADKGLADFLRFLYGIEDQHRRGKLESIVSITGAELASAAEGLAAAMDSANRGIPQAGIPTVIAGAAEAEKAAAKLGVEIRMLPV
ncbi:peptidase M16 [Spirochaetia bacterium]|nr:peptidase M16 [Spirochaetia bacterium]